MERNYYGPEMHVAQLVRMGGKTPAGDPMYRLVLAGQVTIKLGFAWEEWDESTPYELRHGSRVNPETGVLEHAGYKPLRVQTEMREVTKYEDTPPDEWVMERWRPPSMAGTKEEWYAPENCVPGTNLCKRGMFPSEGFYDWAVGSFKEPPSLSFCADMIGNWERNREAMSTDMVKYAREQEAKFQERYDREQEQKVQNTVARITDAMSPIATISLAAGRWRQEMYEKAGFRGHVGN